MGDRTSRHTSLRRVVAALLLVVVAPVVPAPAAYAEPLTMVSDDFARTTVGGWGEATTGGPYTVDGPTAAYATDGAAGSMRLPKPGASRGAILGETAAADVDIRVRVLADRPAGGKLFAYLVARRNEGDEFRPKMIFHPNGTVAVHAGRFVDGSESSIAPPVFVPGLAHTAGAFVRVRALVTGSNPTTIRVKAWDDSAQEPLDWHFEATSSAAGLQGAGRAGLRAYLGGGVTNAPLTAWFDDLVVESLDTPPTPAPPTADFRWAVGADWQTIGFTDTSNGAPTSWSWDFGDGGTSTEQNPSHTYAGEGSYSVTLIATNDGGSTSASKQVDVVSPPPPPDEPTVVAADSFERTAADSWGVAETGGLYSYRDRVSDYDVDVDAGTLLLPKAGATRSAFLFSTLALDTELSFAVSTDKAAGGAAIFVYGSLRRATDGSAYRPKIRIAPDGSVYAHAGKFLAGGGESSLGPAVVVPGIAHAPGQVLRFRAQAAGSNPTTVSVRVWADGQPEPSEWHFTATDSTPILQSAGSVGILAHLASGSTSAPLVVRIDDLLATTAEPVERVEGVTLVGASDIALCGTNNYDEATATLLDMIEGTVFTAGDNAQLDATSEEFANCYDPTWGRHKARTRPALGNHEYHAAPDAGPYFDYFGPGVGERGKGWYAYDAGTWRVYVLNSNCGRVGCTAGSEQEQWLRTDLAANPRQCSIGIWHQARFSSATTRGSHPSVQPFWQALYDAGAELVISGHDHDYERFAPLDAGGQPDPTGGIRQFVVGTGGAGLRDGFAETDPKGEVRQASAHGVLKLTLGDTAYEWEFIPIAGQTFTDRGSGNCH